MTEDEQAILLIYFELALQERRLHSRLVMVKNTETQKKAPLMLYILAGSVGPSLGYHVTKATGSKRVTFLQSNTISLFHFRRAFSIRVGLNIKSRA